MRTLTLKEGLDIQAKDLARWKTKLTAEVYEDLERYANTDKENWSDGFDVKRGNTLSTFIANWNPFNFGTALKEWGMNFGDECNGLLFNFDGSNNTITLRYPSSVIDKMIGLYSEVYFEVFEVRVGKQLVIEMYLDDELEDTWAVNYGKTPTNQTEFEEFTKFLIGQLCTVESKFAEVDECILDRDKLEYTVHGFLIPIQTIKFDHYSDWDCIKGVMGQPIFDCQIDDDEDENGIIYNFQIVDLNYDVDEGRFDLDDTPKVGGGHINRDYTGVHLVFKEEELEVVHHGLLKTIEVREFKIGNSLYEVVIDATEERPITNINAEKGEVTPQIMEALQNAVEKILEI